MAVAPPQPGWGDVIREHAATDRTAQRLTEQLRACEAAALAFCRLLERWNRGEAVPATAGAREAALRHAADRVETAIAGLEVPLSRYLLELEPERAEGRSWYGGPGRGRARRVAPDPRSRRRARLPEPRRRRLPRARGARAGARGPRRCGAPRQLARSLVALGGPVRPPRHAARLDGRRPPRARRLARARGEASASPAGYARPVPAPRITVVGSVNLDLVVALRAAAASRRDRDRRDPRAVPRRQGSQPGRRLRAARRQRSRSSARSAATRSPTRRSPGCARQESSSTCARPTSRPASR